MEMLVGYAAAHQHPFNVGLHLVGIPVIMLGLMIPLSWLSITTVFATVNGAQLTALAFFAFYLTLDVAFAVVFLIGSLALAHLATQLGGYPLGVAGTIAAVAAVGGYLAQFIGHAIEKSMPVLIRHPIQAHLAAPFFVVVEVFGLLRLRRQLFEEVQSLVDQRRSEEASVAA